MRPCLAGCGAPGSYGCSKTTSTKLRSPRPIVSGPPTRVNIATIALLSFSSVTQQNPLSITFTGVFRPPLASHLPATVFIKKTNLSGGMTSPRGVESGGIPRSISNNSVSTASGRQSNAADTQKQQQSTRAEAYVPIPPERVLLWYCARIVLASPGSFSLLPLCYCRCCRTSLTIGT
jgi:hypothetical protein